MKKDSKVRLFEVMSRLDKTFKTKLNEEFEFGGEEKSEELPAAIGGESPETEEKSVEEKYEELKAEVNRLYTMIHGEETPAEGDEGDDGIESLQEWNFDKKKNENSKEEKKETKSHEDSETPAEEKAEHKVDEAGNKKVPVAAIAKVGK